MANLKRGQVVELDGMLYKGLARVDCVWVEKPKPSKGERAYGYPWDKIDAGPWPQIRMNPIAVDGSAIHYESNDHDKIIRIVDDSEAQAAIAVVDELRSSAKKAAQEEYEAEWNRDIKDAWTDYISEGGELDSLKSFIAGFNAGHEAYSDAWS